MSISSDTLLLLLGITLMYSTPMVFAAQGSVISEVSGVVNIGIEGMMTIGAFTGAAVGYFSGNGTCRRGLRTGSRFCLRDMQSGPDSLRYRHEPDRSRPRAVPLQSVL